MPLCTLGENETIILQPEKCDMIGWFDLDEMRSLPLVSYMYRLIEELEHRYRGVLPDFYS